MKRIYIIMAAIVLFSFGVPLAGRVKYESENKSFAVAADYYETKEIFGDDSDKILISYKDSGAKNVIIIQPNGKFDRQDVAQAKSLGFEVALSMNLDSEFSESDAQNLKNITEEFDVRYLNFKSGNGDADDKTLERICGIFEENDVILLLSENKNQLSNEDYFGKNEIFEAAHGRVMRVYSPGNDAFFEESDYDLASWKMLNSAYGRNTKFLEVKTIDKTADKYENARFTEKNILNFTYKMNSLGYEQNAKVDFDGYTEVSTTVYGMLAVLILLMCFAMIKRLFNMRKNTADILCALFSVVVFVLTFFLPKNIIILYTTLFAIVAPCFAITEVYSFAYDKKETYGFYKLVFLSGMMFAVICFVCCLIVAVMLSGIKYYVNEYVFYGVKICLILPVAYALVFGIFKAEIKFKGFSVGKIKIYHIAWVAAFVFAAVLYILRSGNLQISHFQTCLRNYLTDIFTARPRTKEVLVGYPAFSLALYFIKNNSKFLQVASVCASGILFASVINTFCHSFAFVQSMCLRFANGLLMGFLFTAFVFCAGAFVRKIGKFAK